MAGQTTEFPNRQGLAPSVAMCGPSSNALDTSDEPSFDEALGRNWQAMEAEIDQHLCTEEPCRNTPLRRDQPSRFATAAELSSSIVHQLNEPLTSMLANAQAAKRWLAAEPPNLMEAIASIDRIARDARDAGRAMGQIEALVNQASLDKREATIPDLMSEAVRLVREDPNMREVPIEWHCDENVPRVCVDSAAIREVLINLISKAMEAVENTRKPSLVKVQAAVNDKNRIVIRVLDNGPGIGEPEEAFDAFVTTKKSELGICLAVSRSIAEAHGGRLWAENNPSGGATFCLALPLTSRNRNSMRFDAQQPLNADDILLASKKDYIAMADFADATV